MVPMKQRYVTLAPQYMLRGWQDHPDVLYDWSAAGGTGAKTLDLTPAQRFGIELAATPGVSIDAPLLLPSLKKAAQKMLDAGIFVECDKETGLKEYQKYRKFNTRMTHALLWSITGRCNLKCRHCYVSADEGVYGEFSFAQCEEIVQQMLEAGIYSVAITGGEPLVHPDFWRILDLLVEKHIYVEEIFTNGMLVTDAFLDKLEQRNLNMNCFLLSFDGVGCHDWMRGVKGAEEKVIAAIRRLHERGYATIVSTVVHEGNLSSLPATYELMKELGVNVWKIAPVVNSGNWKKKENTTLASKAFTDACMSLLERYVADGLPLGIKLGALFECRWSGGEMVYHIPSFCASETLHEQDTLCEAVRVTPLLLANGKLLTCLPMAGTILEDMAPNILTEEWNISRALVESPVEAYTSATYGELFKKNAQCGSCKHRLRCNHCPAEGLNVGNDIFAIDGHNCLIADGGYEARVHALMQGKCKKRD